MSGPEYGIQVGGEHQLGARRLDGRRLDDLRLGIHGGIAPGTLGIRSAVSRSAASGAGATGWPAIGLAGQACIPHLASFHALLDDPPVARTGSR